MVDRRQHKRLALDDRDICGNMVFANDVKILDISLSGISFKADRRLNIGCNYLLKVKDKRRSLHAKGTIVWSLLNEYKKGIHGDIIPIYSAGMKFADFSHEKRTEIAKFIEDCKRTVFAGDHQKKFDEQVDAYRLSELRHFIRVSINTPEAFIKNCQESFRVKGLGLTHMQIESRQALEIERKFNMKLSFPDDQTISILGCVSSCCVREHTDPENYIIGIEFIDISEKDRETLREFIFLNNIGYR